VRSTTPDRPWVRSRRYLLAISEIDDDDWEDQRRREDLRRFSASSSLRALSPELGVVWSCRASSTGGLRRFVDRGSR
ncbi:hypothetical protein Dimus_030512, partial [Dionaea muscipula]